MMNYNRIAALAAMGTPKPGLLREIAVAMVLIGLDAGARILPHPPDFTPVAASALFAAVVVRSRALALAVPIGGLFVGDSVLGYYDWRMMAFVYAALALPAMAVIASERRSRLVVPLLVASSPIFFAMSNFAVWAFSGIYVPNLGGLIGCYVAALPFLKNMAAGDLFWGLVLFGALAVVRRAGGKSTAPVLASV